MLIKSNLHLYNYKSQKKKGMKHWVYASFSFLLVSFIFYFFFISSYFSVSKIQINGAESIPLNELGAKVANVLEMNSFIFLKNSNIFILPSNFLTAELLNQFPKIETVTLKKNIFKREISIFVTERKEAGIACKAKESLCFYFDKNGVIFSVSPIILGARVLTIIDKSISQDMMLPKNKYTPKDIEFIDSIKKKTVESGKFAIRSFSFLNDHGDISAETAQEFKIFFNSRLSQDEQIKTLNAVLEKEIKDSITNLEYVDLRVESRVYYKMR